MNQKMYTNAYRFGKNIRYLGYENGKRVQRTIENVKERTKEREELAQRVQLIKKVEAKTKSWASASCSSTSE